MKISKAPKLFPWPRVRKAKGADPERPPPLDSQAICEVALFREVMELDPTHLTRSELLLRMREFGSRGTTDEDWELGIKHLIGDGVFRSGELISPSNAARRVYELLDG